MFNEEERALALARLDADQSVETRGRKEKTSLRTTWSTFATRFSVNQEAGPKWQIPIYYVGSN